MANKATQEYNDAIKKLSALKDSINSTKDNSQINKFKTDENLSSRLTEIRTIIEKLSDDGNEGKIKEYLIYIESLINAKISIDTLIVTQLGKIFTKLNEFIENLGKIQNDLSTRSQRSENIHTISNLVKNGTIQTEIDNCLEDIETTIEELIENTTSTPQNAGSKYSSNTDYFTNITNKVDAHSQKLIDIKKKYEKGLNDTVQAHKNLCTNLTTFIQNLETIIKNFRDVMATKIGQSNRTYGLNYEKIFGIKNTENLQQNFEPFKENKAALEAIQKTIEKTANAPPAANNNDQVPANAPPANAQAATTQVAATQATGPQNTANNNPPAAPQGTTGGRKRNTQKNKTKTKKQSGVAKKTKKQSGGAKKTKKQSGGFVRGGVLFPESFYKADIVM